MTESGRTYTTADDPLPRRHPSDALIAGWTATGVGLCSLAMVGLYFVYAGPPPAVNVLTRSLLTIIIFAGLSMFAVALFRALHSAHGGDLGIAGQSAVAALLIYVAVTYIATSLEAGTALQYPDGSLDPTTDGPLAAAMALAHGPIAHLLRAMFFIGTALSVAQVPGNTRVMPDWMRRGNIIVAAINLACIPSLYFGMDATHFYAINGWGADALTGLISLTWIGVLGLGLITTHRTNNR